MIGGSITTICIGKRTLLLDGPDRACGPAMAVVVSKLELQLSKEKCHGEPAPASDLKHPSADGATMRDGRCRPSLGLSTGRATSNRLATVHGPT